jgi:hypothetical protein
VRNAVPLVHGCTLYTDSAYASRRPIRPARSR